MSHSLLDFNPFRHCNHLIKCYASFLSQHSQSVICHSLAVTNIKYDCLMILEPRNMMLGLAFQITTAPYSKAYRMVFMYIILFIIYLLFMYLLILGIEPMTSCLPGYMPMSYIPSHV